MESLKAGFKNMQSTVGKQEAITNTPSGGFNKRHGITIIPPKKQLPKTVSVQNSLVEKEKSQGEKIPHNKITQAQESAESLRTFVKSKQPRKEYDVFGKARLVYAPRTAEEDTTIEKASQPCGEDLALTLYVRYLRVHKKTIITDQDVLDMIRDDFVSCMAGFPEYAVTLALIGIIQESEDIWFPALATLLKAMEKHMVYEPKIRDHERGFRSEEEIAKMLAWGKDVDMGVLREKILEECRKKRGEQNNSEG